MGLGTLTDKEDIACNWGKSEPPSLKAWRRDGLVCKTARTGVYCQGVHVQKQEDLGLMVVTLWSELIENLSDTGWPML